MKTFMAISLVLLAISIRVNAVGKQCKLYSILNLSDSKKDTKNPKKLENLKLKNIN